MTIEVSPKRRALLDALNIAGRDLAAGALSLDAARLEAQRIADQDDVAMVIGWQINDETGLREAGYLPLAAIETLVLEPVEVVRPYRGGRQDFADRQEARRERLETAAERARRESTRRYQASRAAVEHIPLGQPILVGHHSERGHRAALRRADSHMSACVAASKRAEVLAQRAESVGDGGVLSDDPEALVKLRAQLVELEARQEHMKQANAIIRRFKTDPEKCVEQLTAGGVFTEERARQLLRPDFMQRIGFPNYALSNNNANIRRVRARIADLERNAQIPEGEVMRSKSGVIYQIGDNRVQLVFPGKPAENIRARLKSYGFRWAPSAGAWQRHLNAAGKNTAQLIIEWLDQEGL